MSAPNVDAAESGGRSRAAHRYHRRCRTAAEDLPIAPPPDVPDHLAAAAAAVLQRHATERPLVLAASGGADSTALALVVAALRARAALRPRQVVLAHCDHGQHARAAAAAAAVEATAARLGFGFVRTRLDLPPGAGEARMREARYAALVAIARGCGSDLVATAHHRDDQLETVLMRARRGTGPRGLAGIPEVRSLADGVAVARPLLGAARSELRALVAAAGIAWVEDPTNTDLRRTRAQLRHRVIPRLAARPGTVERVLALAAAARRRAAVDEAAARAWIGAHARAVGPARIELRDACRAPADGTSGDGAPPDVRREVFRLLHVALAGTAPLGRWLDAVVALCRTGASLETGLVVERTRCGSVLVDPRRAGAGPPGPVPLELDGRTVGFGTTVWQLRARPTRPQLPAPCPLRERAVFDRDAVRTPLRLRAPRADDRFDAPGSGPRPLRAVLQARGVPRLDRGALPLLVDADDRVLWAPGLDVAAFARLVPGTTRAVLVERVLPPGGIPVPERPY